MTSAPKTRILVVDDHQMMREGLRGLLESDPSIEVVGEACDGREAVEATATLKPDLVVMDVVMRGMNGIAAAAVPAAMKRGVGVPTVRAPSPSTRFRSTKRRRAARASS